MKETDSPTIHIIIKKVPTTTPTANPPSTSLRECWRRTILLVPRIPASRMVVQSHGMGMYAKMTEKAITAPTTPPMAAR